MTLKWIGKPVPRQDAGGKVTGATRFMSDLSFPGMLWGRVLRSRYPHALIKSIDTGEAARLPGVVAVLTHHDVPGLNGYGIVVQDQPVLCSDKVRYMGDAVALVAAETKEIAARALELIRVEYEELPGVFDPEEAMQAGAPQVHATGNIFRHTAVAHGDVEAAFAEADVIVENVYRTSRQMPAFLETEGGVALLDAGGLLTVWCGSQYPDRDVIQIARALGMANEKIRVIANPVGGGFGGKDEVTIQIHLALLAMKTMRPVKIVLSREESVVTGWKKHPMVIRMKTGARRDGSLVAHQVTIVSDTGAYASLGGTILNSAIEHCSGPYRVPNVQVDGYCVYTNNSVSGAMRGFGVNQVTFAMETQMEILAEKLAMDRLAIRLKNGLQQGDKGALGNDLVTAMGPVPTLAAAGATDLWRQREVYKANPSRPWKRRGVGLAAAIKGCGLGFRLPDFGTATIELLPGGYFRVGVGCPEIGQGNSIAYAQMAAEVLGCPVDQVEVVTGDTAATPDSGTSTASRSVYVAGNAIIIAGQRMRERLREVAAAELNVPAGEIDLCEGLAAAGGKSISYTQLAARMLAGGKDCRELGRFHSPKADQEIAGAYGLPHLVFGTHAHVVLVEVDTLTGQVEVLETVALPDAGRVINRQGLEGQSEGGTLMGMGYALSEEVVLEKGVTKTLNFNNYIIPTAVDAPPVATIPVEVMEQTGPFGAKGIGEAVCISITPAITNAIYDAVGVRITELPANLERVLAGMQTCGIR
ncbi:MAG: xanthine dehydrogenase family protein molybdopterin-binding subunit [Bacillota bacterium]